MAADKHLSEQISQIIDEGEGKTRSVIVQVRAGGSEKPAKIAASRIAAALQQRGLAQSSRELLPRRLAKSTPKSKPSETIKSIVDLWRTRNRRLLDPLMASDVVKSQPASAPAIAIWPSRSIVLELHKDKLHKLNELTDAPIRNVYPNRSIQTPRIQRVRDLPEEVKEATASSWGLSKVGALSVWGAYDARGAGVTVAVLDTGVDAAHTALQGRVAKFIQFDKKALEVKGVKPHDSNSHGTHCCGTIAGGRTRAGQWIGVAPEAKLAVARVLDGDQGGTEAQVLAGLQWAIDSGVDVISLSLGGLVLDVDVPDTYTEAFALAMSAGITVVTAIGNEGSQTTGSPGNNWLSFSVGATDHLDRAAGFSGGRTHIMTKSRTIPRKYLPLVYAKPDISAPGVAILSSVPGGKFDHFNGTSMATPHVAGAVALLLSATSIRQRYSGVDRVQAIKGFLQGSVRELGEAGQNHRFGFGRLDILRAIGFAKERGL